MTDSTQGPDTGVDRPRKGLAARAAGVIFSPRETYAEVAARPRAFGILALAILLMAGLQGWLLSTDTGQQALFDRPLQTLEAFGATVTDEMYQQLESRLRKLKRSCADSEPGLPSSLILNWSGPCGSSNSQPGSGRREVNSSCDCPPSAPMRQIAGIE